MKRLKHERSGIAAACGMLSRGNGRRAWSGNRSASDHSFGRGSRQDCAFYRDGLGMQPVGPGGKPVTAHARAAALDESLSKFTDTHGAKFRNASFDIPGTTLRAGTDRIQRHATQTGCPAHAGSRRCDSRAHRARRGCGARRREEERRIGVKHRWRADENWRRGQQEPLGIRERSRRVHAGAGRHPTAPKSSAPADSNILGGRIGVTIKDTDQTMKFYHDVLGFETKPAPVEYQTNATIASLIDAKGAHWRISSAKVPGRRWISNYSSSRMSRGSRSQLRVPDLGLARGFGSCERRGERDEGCGCRRRIHRDARR